MIARDMIVGLFSDWQCGSCGKGKEVGGKEERWGEGVRQKVWVRYSRKSQYVTVKSYTPTSAPESSTYR